jgi:pimeloyl-ACP methyl ester carboxylesterase
MTTQTETSIMRDYAAAGGLRTYYEAQGTGDPLVMLHGGFATVDTFGAAFTPLIASRYRVYSPERRGHGRMPDVGGPITYEIMAGDDDFVAVEHLEAMRTTLPDGQLAIVPGTSHGLPLEKPELVSRLIFDFLSDEQAEKLMPNPR